MIRDTLKDYFFGGGVAGTDFRDSKRLAVSKRLPQKEGEIYKIGEWIAVEIKQLLQDTCMVQSDASIGCMGDAKRLADNSETINIMAIANVNLLLFFKRKTFFNISKLSGAGNPF
jgi:hypothetical protein